MDTERSPFASVKWVLSPGSVDLMGPSEPMAMLPAPVDLCYCLWQGRHQPEPQSPAQLPWRFVVWTRSVIAFISRARIFIGTDRKILFRQGFNTAVKVADLLIDIVLVTSPEEVPPDGIWDIAVFN